MYVSLLGELVALLLDLLVGPDLLTLLAKVGDALLDLCLLYTSPSPRD